jgi:high-affinity iron transporter
MLLFCLLLHGRLAMATEPAQLILHMLDYMAVDYPEFVQDGAVLDQAEYAEQLDFAQQVRELLEQLPAAPRQPDLLQQAGQLLTLVQAKAAGAKVATLARQLRWDVIRAYDVDIAPRHLPVLAQAAALYQTHCAACHGAQGQGDGPAGRSLDPPPSNFHDRARLEQRSVYGLYSTITLGVQGTAMAAFQTLSEAERWTLAFYVSNFSTPPATLAPGAALWQSGAGHAWFPDLARVATATTSEVRSQHGEDGVRVLAYLRQHPEVLEASTEAPLSRSARLLRESLRAYRQGQARNAQDLAVSAYLDGFELIEARLDTVSRQLRQTVEADMLQYRALMKNNAPLGSVEAQASRLQGLLHDAQALLERARISTTATFLSALIILLREGLEAILIVAAIFAFLTRVGRRDALPYVHVGWLAALAGGLLTWFVAAYLLTISGATREITEGVTALLAAVVLLYVGFWMHSKAYADRWRTFLTQQLQGSLSAPTLWTLALVSFLAVYREAFETVLFYQALWLQAAPAYGAVLGGCGTAVVALALLGWLIFKGSVRLPLGQFFGLTSILLALLAVVFAGHGIAALQEAGAIPADPVPFPGIPALGLYPNVQGMVTQAILLVVIAGVFVYTYATTRTAR